MNASVIADDGNSTFTEASLDLCTIEGIPQAAGGKPVKGVMPNDTTLPENTCRPAADQPGGYVPGVCTAWHVCKSGSGMHKP